MRSRLFAGVIAAIVGATLSASPPTTAAQGDEPGNTGSVELVEVGTGQAITEGDSSTVFNLRVPMAASCPGDSRNDGYRYHAYFVPAGTDVGELAYDNVGPAPGNPYLALRTAQGRPFVHELLAPNGRPGLPGLIPPDNQLMFGGWPEPGLTPGRYIVGIACTEPTAWEVVQYFDLEQEVEIVDDPTSDSWGSLWRLVDTGGSTLDATVADDDADSPWLLLVGVGGVVLVIAVILGRRRSASTPRELERQT